MEISCGKPTVLLTLGRLPVALELARALYAGGWRVLVAEPFAWHICRLSKAVDKSFTVTSPTTDTEAYLTELLDIVVGEQVTLVIPVSEETLFVSALKGRLPEPVELLCLGQDMLLQLHDKYRFACLAEEHGLAVAQTALASDIIACKALTNRPYVLKPRLSCAGVGVRFKMAGSLLEGDEISERYLVQSRLPGAACSSFSIASSGKVLTSICYRSLIESGSVSVCFQQTPVPDDIVRFIDTIIRVTHFSGMIAFDFMQDESGLWQAIECNPRATSGLHFMASSDTLKCLVNKGSVDGQSLSEKRMEFWSCLFQVEGALFKGRIDRDGWKHLVTSKDINWRLSDPKPFLLMSFVLAPQLFKAARAGRPVSEILMGDVGWHDSALGQ